MQNKIQIFEKQPVRAVWDEEGERGWFSVVDIVGVLTDSPNPRKYWSVLKTRLKQEGNETVTNCSQLKLLMPDDKMRSSYIADTEKILRIIQSVPSKKAEPFKMWLAKVGAERIDETVDPELSIDRATHMSKMWSGISTLSRRSGKSRWGDALLTIDINLRKMSNMRTLQSPAGTILCSHYKCRPCGTWWAYTKLEESKIFK